MQGWAQNSSYLSFNGGTRRMSSRATNNAVLYLRSSKDRSDVSIDAQRRELTALASQRGLVVVGEFTDSWSQDRTRIVPA